MEFLIYITFGILGLFAGNLANVLIVRVPLKMKTFKPSFRCESCKGRIRWYDNIPIISFFILKGRCRNCKSRIPLFYLFNEFMIMVLWILCAFLFWKIDAIISIIFALTCSILMIIAFIDFSHKIIPDRFIIFLFILGIIAMIFCGDLTFIERIFGFVLGGGIFLIFYIGGLIFAKREIMGLGDIKLMAVTGLIVGWQIILLALFIGSILASLILLILQMKKKSKIKKQIKQQVNDSCSINNLLNEETESDLIKSNQNDEYPLAPFLVFGIIFAMIFGTFIIEWYAKIFT